MIHLPSLVLYEIFKHFSLKEKIKLRRVCSSWKLEIDKFTPTTLCIHETPFPCNLYWSLTGQLVGQQNCVDALNQQFFKSTFPLQRVKKLYASSITLNDLGIALAHLNYFERIEQLEICGHGEFNENVKLSFKNLRNLSLNHCEFGGVLELDCPQLENFVYYRTIGERIKFHNPTSLKYVELREYEPSIKQFIQMRRLVLIAFKSIDLKVLGQLDQLKEIHLNVTNYMHIDIERFDFLLEKLKTQFEVCVTFFKYILNAHWCSEPLKFKLDHGNTMMIKSNYSKLPSRAMNWSFEVDYTALIRTFISMPLDFFEKFVNIRSIEVSKESIHSSKIDEKKLIEFLLNYKHCLTSLKLDESLVSEMFYDHLDSLYNLEQLELHQLRWYTYNYRFLILNLNVMKNLRKLHISFLNQNCITFELVHNVLATCNRIEELVIQGVFVLRKTNEIYSLSFHKSNKMEIIFTDSNNLIRYFASIDGLQGFSY